jgi:hypothetical protein
MISKSLISILRSAAKYSKNIAKGRKYTHAGRYNTSSVSKRRKKAWDFLLKAYKNGEISKATFRKALKSGDITRFVDDILPKVPQGPILNLASAVVKPTMGRREFLNRSGKILSEANMQRKLAKSVTDLYREQRVANTWLKSAKTVGRVKKMSGPMFGELGALRNATGGFNKKLKNALEVSTYGHKNPFDFHSYLRMDMSGKTPKSSIGRYFYWRDKLNKRYGHKYGTGTYINETFKIPKASVIRKSADGRDYVGQPWREDAEGVLGYIKDLTESTKGNPLLDAFREGLYGK